MNKRVSVIGLGYLGVTHAVAMAKIGHNVIGYDISLSRVQSLQEGNLPFFEPGLFELLSEVLASGRLQFRNELSDWVSDIDVHFICVGTPQDKTSGAVDLSQIESVVSELSKKISPNSVLVGRSTTPVGTARRLKELSENVSGTKVHLAWNPEFLSEGTAVRDSLSPDRIVIGASDDFSEKTLKAIYEPLILNNVPLVSLDLETSELLKVAANSFLALKISFINGVASIAEESGASTKALADALGLDPRIAPGFLKNGLGFGGGCLPKDLVGFAHQARLKNKNEFADLLQSAYEINNERIQSTVRLVEHAAFGNRQAKIALLGISFKPGTDDIRESQSLKLLDALNAKGFETKAHDPVALTLLQKIRPAQFVNSDVESVVSGVDVVIIGTEWSEYSELKPEVLGELVHTKTVIDTRGIINKANWANAGWAILALGESTSELA